MRIKNFSLTLLTILILAISLFTTCSTASIKKESIDLDKNTYDKLFFENADVTSRYEWIKINELRSHDSVLNFGFEVRRLQAFNTTFKKYVIVKDWANIVNCTAPQGIGITPRTAGSLCFNGMLSIHVGAFSFEGIGTSYKDLLKYYSVEISICPLIKGVVFVSKNVQLKNFYSQDTRVAVERGGYGKIVDSSLREARVYKGGILFLNKTYVETLACEGACSGDVSVQNLYLSGVWVIENIGKNSLKIYFKNGMTLTANYVQQIFVVDSNNLMIIIKDYSASLPIMFSNTSALVIAKNVELKKIVAKNNSSIRLDYQYVTEIEKDNSSEILKTVSLIHHDVGDEKHNNMWIQYGQEMSAPEFSIKYRDSSIVTTREYLSKIYKFHPTIIAPLLTAVILACLSRWGGRNEGHES